MVLHEDGPTFQFIIEQLPAFTSAVTGVFSAWMAWRSKRDKQFSEPTPSRSVRVEIGQHRYEGPAGDTDQLEAVVRTLAALSERT